MRKEIARENICSQGQMVRHIISLGLWDGDLEVTINRSLEMSWFGK